MEGAGRKLKMGRQSLPAQYVVLRHLPFALQFVYIVNKFGILQNEVSEGCKCPVGFKGDGGNSCEGIIQKVVVYRLEFNIVLKGQKLILYLYILDQRKYLAF
jgi:hypothetical protein